MLCHRRLRNKSKHPHVVDELGQILVDKAEADGCMLRIIRIHILPVLMESGEIGGKLPELFHHILFIQFFKEFRQILPYEFFTENTFVSFLSSEGLTYGCT